MGGLTQGGFMHLGGGRYTGQVKVSISNGVATAVLATGVSVTSYQWKLDGVALAGETASTYTLKPSDIGKVLSVDLIGVSFDAGVSIPLKWRVTTSDGFVLTTSNRYLLTTSGE